jgi:hypothetical protein
MLIVNRYTCPIKGKITSQAHDIQNGGCLISYPKMDGLDLSFFKDYETIIICDVVRSQNLSQVNIIFKGEQL